MTHYIPQFILKLTIFLGMLPLITSCNTSSMAHIKNYETKTIVLPSGEELQTYIAEGPLKQATGLSNVKDNDFSESEAMFFPGSYPKLRQFWMPETHFNLDLIFLSEDLYVLDIQRNLQHFKSATPKKNVPMSKEVFCTHVLEIKANSKISSKIKHGMILKWKNKTK